MFKRLEKAWDAFWESNDCPTKVDPPEEDKTTSAEQEEDKPPPEPNLAERWSKAAINMDKKIPRLSVDTSAVWLEAYINKHGELIIKTGYYILGFCFDAKIINEESIKKVTLSIREMDHLLPFINKYYNRTNPFLCDEGAQNDL